MLFMKSKNRKKQSRSINKVLSQQKVKTILRTLASDVAFYFYEDVGKPTGQGATSLIDFCDKISKTNIPEINASLVFHQKRGDFSKWIRDIIGDHELADRINNVSHDDIHMKRKLVKILNTRKRQLKEMLIEYTLIPEDAPAVMPTPNRLGN